MASSLTVGKPSAIKRSKSFSAQSPSVSFATNKRVCLAPCWSRRNSATVAALYSSSSSEEEDDDSENETCYLNNQRRARKRANSLRKQSISLVDDKLNSAISQYSDIDDEDVEEKEVDKDTCNSITSSTPSSPKQKSVEKSLDALARRDSQVGFSSDSKSIGKKTDVDRDRIARDRCFDYLVSAIDEAWARYCDATSYAEDEVYNKVDYIPNTPASIGMSENEDDEDDHEEEDDDLEAGYRSSATNLTEYDSEVEGKKVSGQPSSVKLQQLKDRLLKAKYYLQDYLEVDDAQEAIAFWRRWDLVKYATIELVEDDDDDEVIESTIEELEKGRLYNCC